MHTYVHVQPICMFIHTYDRYLTVHLGKQCINKYIPFRTTYICMYFLTNLNNFSLCVCLLLDIIRFYCRF